MPEYFGHTIEDEVGYAGELLETDSDEAAISYFKDIHGSKLERVERVEGDLDDDVRVVIWDPDMELFIKGLRPNA